MLVTKVYFPRTRLASRWNRKKSQSEHEREMINSKLYYWKVSVIRCSHLPGESAHGCGLGSNSCFFINGNFFACAQKTTPMGAPAQENGCVKTPMRPLINLALLVFVLSKSVHNLNVQHRIGIASDFPMITNLDMVGVFEFSSMKVDIPKSKTTHWLILTKPKSKPNP